MTDELTRMLRRSNDANDARMEAAQARKTLRLANDQLDAYRALYGPLPTPGEHITLQAECAELRGAVETKDSTIAKLRAAIRTGDSDLAQAWAYEKRAWEGLSNVAEENDALREQLDQAHQHIGALLTNPYHDETLAAARAWLRREAK